MRWSEVRLGEKNRPSGGGGGGGGWAKRKVAGRRQRRTTTGRLPIETRHKREKNETKRRLMSRHSLFLINRVHGAPGAWWPLIEFTSNQHIWMRDCVGRRYSYWSSVLHLAAADESQNTGPWWRWGRFCSRDYIYIFDRPPSLVHPCPTR